MIHTETIGRVRVVIRRLDEHFGSKVKSDHYACTAILNGSSRKATIIIPARSLEAAVAHFHREGRRSLPANILEAMT